MEAKVDAATQDVDAFSQGGPAMETPTAIADRMHALSCHPSQRSGRLHRRLA
jgi:hypothetical protein